MRDGFVVRKSKFMMCVNFEKNMSYQLREVRVLLLIGVLIIYQVCSNEI